MSAEIFKGAFSGLAQFLQSSPLIMRKNSFSLDFLVMYKSSLIRKIRLISKFMTSQPEKQTVAIHTSPNISRSKGLFYFLEKSYTKCAEETIPRPFPKNPKLDTSLD